MKLGLEKGLEKAALKLANLTFAIEIVPKPIFKLMIYKKVWNKIHTTFFSLLLNEFSPHFLPNQKEACVVFTKSRNYIGYIRIFTRSRIHRVRNFTEVFLVFLRSWFSGLLLKEVVNLSGIKLVHRMTPESKTGELFNGELGVKAVLDPKRWKHEVQHGCALLSVHCHSLLQTEKFPHLGRPIRQQYLPPRPRQPGAPLLQMLQNQGWGISR